MLIPSSLSPMIKGREQKDPGSNAIAGASQSDSNPNRRHAYAASAQPDGSEEAKAPESQSSRLIDKSPISSATQAALLALLSEPFVETDGGGSFAEIVEEATLEQSAAADQENPIDDEDPPAEDPPAIE